MSYNGPNTGEQYVGAETGASPRYPRQLDVDVDGLEIVTSHVATGGVQLSCPEMRYKGFERSTRGASLRFKIRLPGTQNWLAVVGHVRYANLCDDE